ncbi:hypothetical protein GN958_ATG06644 [Phytophthora infestans]|uniref:Uncharacterized protein n=1 Tax=Phytophthora infestans TaxID=4787 RepID=A0A8S9UU16_PHYIN|nr:hypothetical protein GN958_ATG06644 [Phytophthora infestans]
MTIFVEAEHAVSDVSAANLCVSTSEAAPGSTPLLFCDAVVEGHKLRMLVDLGVSHCIGKPGNVVPFPVEQKVNITARGFDGKSESRVVCTGKLVVSVERCQSTQAPFLRGQVIRRHKLRMLVDLGASHCIGKPGNVVPFPVEQKVNITARGFDGKSESRVVCTGKLVVSVERCQSTQAPFLSGQVIKRKMASSANLGSSRLTLPSTGPEA